MDHERVRRRRDAADRREILARIVAEISVEARRDAERPGVAEADRVPPAPARLSTTTCWPISPLSFSAMMRMTMLVLPPGGNGTISVIGRLG
jgi:hypothetical protein